MAKPLNERVTSALASDRVTLTDLRTVIADAREELERQRASREAAKADTADLALSDDDRDEAAKNLARADGMIVAYTAAIAELEEKLQAKLNSEKRQAEEAEQAAAVAERDALAERFKAVVPEAVATLTALFDEVQANTKRLKKAGCRNAADAELSARGLKSGGYVGYSPALRFTEMKIPQWDRSGHVWPKRQRQLGVYDESKARQRSADNIAKAKAQFGKYRLMLPPQKDPGIIEQGIPFTAKMPAPMHAKRYKLMHALEGKTRPWEGDLEHSEADRLRGLGVTVELLEDAEFEERLRFYA